MGSCREEGDLGVIVPDQDPCYIGAVKCLYNPVHSGAVLVCLLYAPFGVMCGGSRPCAPLSTDAQGRLPPVKPTANFGSLLSTVMGLPSLKAGKMTAKLV